MNKYADIHIDNVKLSEDEKAVVIIDQSKLPGETVYLTLKSNTELWDAIYTLKVRGAPAIGIFAAYAMYVLAVASLKDTGNNFEEFYPLSQSIHYNQSVLLCQDFAFPVPQFHESSIDACKREHIKHLASVCRCT